MRSLYWINSNGEKVKASLDQNVNEKNGRLCPNISNKLSDSNSFNLQTLDSARLFISYGSPMYMRFVMDANGIVNFEAPDFNNSTDPNLDIYFEFIEFTMTNGKFWGNTSRVDSFCFPLSLRLEGTGGKKGQSIDSIIEPIDITVGDVGSRSSVMRGIQPPYSSRTLKMEDPTAYYQSSPANYYAKFWHDHSINNLAYGFCYDDVADQSTLQYYSQPSTLTISCYWENSTPTPTPTPIPSVVGIKASSNGNYVCSDNYGNDPLIANRTSISDWEKYQLIKNRSTSIDTWEKFKIVQQSDGTIALLAMANNKYVCADANQGAVLYANRDSVSSWETFVLKTP